jgi:hypothetical protein
MLQIVENHILEQITIVSKIIIRYDEKKEGKNCGDLL